MQLQSDPASLEQKTWIHLADRYLQIHAGMPLQPPNAPACVNTARWRAHVSKIPHLIHTIHSDLKLCVMCAPVWAFLKQYTLMDRTSQWSHMATIACSRWQGEAKLYSESLYSQFHITYMHAVIIWSCCKYIFTKWMELCWTHATCVLVGLERGTVCTTTANKHKRRHSWHTQHSLSTRELSHVWQTELHEYPCSEWNVSTSKTRVRTRGEALPSAQDFPFGNSFIVIWIYKIWTLPNVPTF